MSYQYKDPIGQQEYQKALQDWRGGYGTYSSMMGEIVPVAKEQLAYYAPGGGYGAGRRSEAEGEVRKGVAKDIGGMVASGMSSMAGAKGLQMGASEDLADMYKNIEDTRARLWSQALQPYSQLMQTMATMQNARPVYGQYVPTMNFDEGGILASQQAAIGQTRSRDESFWSPSASPMMSYADQMRYGNEVKQAQITKYGQIL